MDLILNFQTKFQNNKFIPMLYSPKRQRILNVPKNRQARPGFLTQRNSSKQSSLSINSKNMEFQFTINDHCQDSLLDHVRQNNKKNTKEFEHLYTLNPEKNKKIKYGHIEKLKKKSLGPVIQDSTDQQLLEKYDNYIEHLGIGKMRREQDEQKPLVQQSPKQIVVVQKPKEEKINIEQKIKQFEDLRKIDSISLGKPRQRLRMYSTLSKFNDPQPSKLGSKIKKQSSLDPSSNLYLKNVTNWREQQKISKYSHLFATERIKNIKQHVNSIVQKNIKKKFKVEDQISGYADESIQVSPVKKGFTFLDNFEKEDENKSGSRFVDTTVSPLSFYSALDLQVSNKVIVTYKTSLNQLKQIESKIQKGTALQLQILVPRLLMNLKTNPSMDKRQLANYSRSLFLGLGLPTDTMNIKKYSNCFHMVSNNIALVLYFEGKVYLGGWRNQYFDFGCKSGLGLQWVPNQYVYYGQFDQSKKDGLGILKTRKQTFVGEWREGKYIQKRPSINGNGAFKPNFSDLNGRNKFSSIQESFDCDPFT